jgi:hypothetical protein
VLSYFKKQLAVLNISGIQQALTRLKAILYLSNQEDIYENAETLEALGPLRIIDLLSETMKEPNAEKCSLAYTCMQLLNLLCDDLPQNYMQMAMAGIYNLLNDLVMTPWKSN